jgi:hypothetical protein
LNPDDPEENRGVVTDANRRVRIARTLEDRARHQAIRDRFQNEPSLSELLESGEISQEAYEVAQQCYLERASAARFEDEAFRRLVSALKGERERLGISLAEIARSTGIKLTALSGLESGQNGNPTVSILSRYAMALGKKITWRFENGSPPNLQDSEQADS